MQYLAVTKFDKMLFLRNIRVHINLFHDFLIDNFFILINNSCIINNNNLVMSLIFINSLALHNI